MSVSGLGKGGVLAAVCAVLAVVSSTAPATDWEIFPSSEHCSSGDVMQQNGAYSIHNGDLKYGKGTPDSKWQGFVRFDLSELPDSLWIEEATLCYQVISASNPPARSYVSHVTIDPLTATAVDLWGAIVGGTHVTGDTAAGAGWVDRVLDSLGIAAIQEGIAEDWVGFGIYKWDTTSTWGHVKGFQTGRVKPRIRLKVQVRDVAVLSIVAPTGEYYLTDTIVPEAVIRNNGELSAPFRAHFTISTGTNTVYRRYIDLPGLTPGKDTTLRFGDWLPDAAGAERVARCSLEMLGDFRPENNLSVSWFTLVAGGQSRARWGWQEVSPVPLLPSAQPVKLGGWLAANAGDGLIYAAKGNKSTDFASYDPVTGRWRTLAPVPAEPPLKTPGKGARGVADGSGSVYLLKGNKSLEFWRYDIAGDRWERLADIPFGPQSGSVRSGTGIAFVEQYGTGYVYVLKGPKNDFVRYNTDTGAWEEMPSAPVGGKNRWDRGSWLVYDCVGKLYAHKANRHEMWTFDLASETWDLQGLPPMPYIGSSLRSKKMRDGACATWLDGAIYSMKGGKTQEFWRFAPESGQWAELETIPQFGTSLRTVRMGQGGDFCAWPYGGALYALKGNKSLEFWRYTFAPEGDGGTCGAVGETRFSVTVSPRIARGSALVRLGGNRPGVAALVSLYDAAGRQVRSTTTGTQSAVRLELSNLAAGAYLVRVEAAGASATEKLVIAR